MKLLVVAGARPNFMKVAALMDAFRARPDVFDTFLVHTGQHYDEALSRVFFDELGIPRPDCNLEVGSDSHARQTARIMTEFEPVIERERPDAIIVVGDVNSTIACALVASKLGVEVIHVEAGLRSGDRSMPEEINRVLTDSISDLLFVSEPSGVENLRREGVPTAKIRFVGNVMIDTLLRHLPKAGQSRVLEELGLEPRGYGVLTLHRPSNVDDPLVFGRILDALESITSRVPIVFPAHPRTVARIETAGLGPRLGEIEGLHRIAPLGYLDFLALQANARIVLTDSGGVQEETTALGVPCLTLRDNTERPVTITEGTNTLTGTDTGRIVRAAEAALRDGATNGGARPELWDGKAAERIAEILASRS